ncbi:MAG: hypothetical protein MJ118_06555, partial [Clostridia bacterium]|nr:hypothetical protein [Clostridia bacterium]
MKNVETTNGFLTRWLICGPRLGDVDVDTSNIPMEDIENRLRARIACEECEAPHRVACGESYSGQTWRYRYTGNNIFVDLSDFYFHLCTVNFYAFTQVEATKDTEQSICLWCYPGTDVWVNGEKVITHEIPVYQPMRKMTAAVQLKQGRNNIFVHCYNLGIRDTRNIFGIQLQGDLTELSNTLPDSDGSITQLMAADAWLDGVKPRGQRLIAQSAPPAACVAELKYGNSKKTVLWEKGSILDMDAGCEEIDLSVSLHGERLTRNLELLENDKPVYRPGDVSIEEHRRRVLAELVELGNEYNPEEDEKGLFSYGVYARLAANGGKLSALDKKILMRALNLVDSCIDCADFSLSVLLRIALTFRIVDEDFQNRIKQVALNFRYWTDEPGKDAMCFTSENHMLLFHGCQMAAGLLYPDDIFTRSGRTGREMNRLGNERCKKWLEQVLTNGFEEFRSEAYLC